MPQRDYYKILGVAKDAKPSEIKKAIVSELKYFIQTPTREAKNQKTNLKFCLRLTVF